MAKGEEGVDKGKHKQSSGIGPDVLQYLPHVEFLDPDYRERMLDKWRRDGIDTSAYDQGQNPDAFLEALSYDQAKCLGAEVMSLITQRVKAAQLRKILAEIKFIRKVAEDDGGIMLGYRFSPPDEPGAILTVFPGSSDLVLSANRGGDDQESPDRFLDSLTPEERIQLAREVSDLILGDCRPD